MKKFTLPILGLLTLSASLASAQFASLPSMKFHPPIQTLANEDEGVTETVLDEDFSLMTEGEEGKPASEYLEDDNYGVPSSLTHKAGWQGYYLRQAGGMVYIDLDPKGIESGVINTPKIDLSKAGGAFSLSFRAKSAIAGNNDKIYVDSKRSASDFSTAEVKVTDEWQTYNLKFENGSETSYIMFSPWLDPVYIDDIKVEVMIPYVAAPTSLTFSNYTVTGFTASWAPVADATGYYISVYTKNSEGQRTYAIENKELPATQTTYEVENLPAAESFYYFALRATDGTHLSPESVEVAVEGLLKPVLKGESNISANGFTATWEPVEHAKSYNFIATREHTADQSGDYYHLNQDFATITGEENSSYDYTSIPELPGWTIASPVFLEKEIGVNSSNGQYGTDAWIQSSEYDFSHNGGKVDFKMDVYGNHKKYTSDIYVGLYTYSDELGRFRLEDRQAIPAVGIDGKLVELTLTGGGKRSIVMIEPDGYAKMMIRSLSLSQPLEAGDEVKATVASQSTTEPTIILSNLDILPGDKVSYKVRAIGRNSTDTSNIYSDYTDDRYVTMPTGVESVAVDASEEVTYFNLQGVRVAEPAAGLYIVRRGDKVAKEIVR